MPVRYLPLRHCQGLTGEVQPLCLCFTACSFGFLQAFLVKPWSAPCPCLSLGVSNPRFLKGSCGLGWEVLQKCHTLSDVVEGLRGNLNAAIDLFPLLQKELLVYQHEISCTPPRSLIHLVLHGLSALLDNCSLTQTCGKPLSRCYLCLKE